MNLELIRAMNEGAALRLARAQPATQPNIFAEQLAQLIEKNREQKRRIQARENYEASRRRLQWPP